MSEAIVHRLQHDVIDVLKQLFVGRDEVIELIARPTFSQLMRTLLVRVGLWDKGHICWRYQV